MRQVIDSRIESLREDVLGHLNEHSAQIAMLLKQHVELVQSIREENKELKAEVERLRRF